MKKKVALGLSASVICGGGAMAAIAGFKHIKNQIMDYDIFCQSYVTENISDHYSDDVSDKIIEAFMQEKRQHPLRFIKHMKTAAKIATELPYDDSKFINAIKDIIGEIDSSILTLIYKEENEKITRGTDNE